MLKNNQNKNNYIEIIFDLNAVILSIDLTYNTNLNTLTIKNNKNILPWGSYNPNNHKTMELGLRYWIKKQTSMDINSVEQLYTFGDSNRFNCTNPNRYIITTGYLASVKPNMSQNQSIDQWNNIYKYFPWEDFRKGRPSVLNNFILPKLFQWSNSNKTDQRIQICFGENNNVWKDENVLARYEIMYEANLVFESIRDSLRNNIKNIQINNNKVQLPTGIYMQYDHRRILATALERIRSKIKYKPIIFNLIPDNFTLFELQKATEAILGHKIHKQNFRRFVEKEKLAIKIGRINNQKSGRPAQMYTYNNEFIGKINIPGIKNGNNKSIY